MARMTPMGNSREFHRRDLLTKILKAGWPTVSDYTDGIAYSLKVQAEDVHQTFLMTLCEMALDDLVIQERVVRLGECAKENTPRAMYLLGMIESDEGGPDSGIPKRWPVLAKEPRSECDGEGED